jgi:hypothetical protein
MRAMSIGIVARSLMAAGADTSALDDIRAELPPDARTELRLLQGDAEGAFERLARVTVWATESGDDRGAIVAGEAKVRALIALGRTADAVTDAGVWLEKAIATEFRTVVWRLHVSRAKARRLEGDESGAADDIAAAAAAVRELAQGIADESKRRSFMSDPLIASIEGLGVQA